MFIHRCGWPLGALAGALLLLGAGVPVLVTAGDAQVRRHVVVDGVPIVEVHPAGVAAGERRPGVVVAHGFAGSATLMAPFGDTLTGQGYVVVLLDFAGHGASTRPLPPGDDATLQHDLAVAVRHLRGLPDVDPSRISLVGHPMGAGAVTRYAAAHPEITGTAALSLPDASAVTPDRPAHLLLLVGALEFAGFRTTAERAVEGAAPGRSAVVVPAVEHISILYVSPTHRAVAAWLAGDRPAPWPARRATGAGLLVLAFAIGMYPLARVLLGDAGRKRPEGGAGRERPGGGTDRERRGGGTGRLGRVVGVGAAAAVVAAVVAQFLPTVRLPLAVGGYTVGYTALAGTALILSQIVGHRMNWRAALTGHPPNRRAVLAWFRPAERPPDRRAVLAAPVLVTYAGLSIAVPLHLGVTHAVPAGSRWWLLPLVWAGFAVLAYGAERITGGYGPGVLVISALVVGALTGAAVVGLAPGFVLLVVPLLALLLAWQAAWSAMLHRFAAPAWLIALAGSLVVAWPVATTLPLTG